jgi:hypothetical protein
LILASLRGEDLDDASVARIRSRFDSMKKSLANEPFKREVMPEERSDPHDRQSCSAS